MSGFRALNVVYEEESEEEVDDSKELQIEEALKLYQNALKWHSQGPNFYDQAEKAYNELFKSEIFTYAESLSEAQWLQRFGSELYDSEDGPEEDLETELLPATASGEGAPSTLPQILYLAYKNHGMFRLDLLRLQLSRIEKTVLSNEAANSRKEVVEAARAGLTYLSEALDRDEGDPELWRRTARVSQFLGSRRIARYCLETVLFTDDVDRSGLEEALANEQLRPILSSISDGQANAQLQQCSIGKRKLGKSFGQHIDPYPYLQDMDVACLAQLHTEKAKDVSIHISEKSWAACGSAILSRLVAEQKGTVDCEPGANYILTSRPIAPANSKFSSSKIHKVGKSTVSPLIDDSVGDQYETGHSPGVLEGTDDLIKVAAGRLDPGSLKSSSAADASIEEDLSPGETNAMTNNVGLSAVYDDRVFGTNDTEVPALDGIDQRAEFEHKTLSIRKRSLDAAGLPEDVDSGRGRSKRIKARGSLADPSALKDTTAEDWTKWYTQQLQIYVEADDAAFIALNQIVSRFGYGSRLAMGSSHDCSDNASVTQSQEATLAGKDLRVLLDGWDSQKSKRFLQGDGLRNASNSPDLSSLVAQSTTSDSALGGLPQLPEDLGLDRLFDSNACCSWTGLSELSCHWLRELLGYRSFDDELPYTSLYESYLWPDGLKETVVKMLVNQDEFLYNEIDQHVHQMVHSTLTPAKSTNSWPSDESLVGLIQTLFELHLDIYGRITNPSSIVDVDTRNLQHDRLSRWYDLASFVMNEISLSPLYQASNRAGWSVQLSYRFLWASIVCQNLVEPSETEYTISCFQDLVQLMKEERDDATEPFVVRLPNNAVMPEISTYTAEKEVSRLTTLDYFTSIFISTDEDPVSVIESLEPLLALSVDADDPDSMSQDEVQISDAEQRDLQQYSGAKDPRLMEALQFLNDADLSLKLFLWQKLQDAYSVINYPPQILVCNLRSLTLIMQHFKSTTYTNAPEVPRQDSLLRMLQKLDNLVEQILALVSTNSTAFECVDNTQILSAIDALSILLHLIHVFAIWEDTIRVGQLQPTPQQTSAATKSQLKSAERFRDLWVKAWTLQYFLIKEAMIQNPKIDMPSELLIGYLRSVHRVLGLRTYCGLSNQAFLKLVRSELWSTKGGEKWEVEVAQLVYDLYGLKISSNAADMQDHACEPGELDRSTALDILDIVLLHVNRMSIKELLKSDLKVTIDKISQVIKVPKITSTASAKAFNKRLIHAYLKGPINPVDLYRSLRGFGEISKRSPTKEQYEMEGYDIAHKGWYFLLGHIALVKFRSQKRITASSMEDLTHAETFFRQDLEFDTEKWETWYRLGQVYDTQVDESVTWTAEKLENDMDGLIGLQRKAILCYSMAIAAAKRLEEPTFEDVSKIANLYADYGTRLYASSREPFSMLPFMLDDFKRQFNGAGTGMYEGVPFKPMSLYSVWKVASSLLSQAVRQKSDDWVPAFKLGKVLWKMHTHEHESTNSSEKHIPSKPIIDHRAVIGPILHAIRLVPAKRDSRHSDKDPILEPHYKLVSIMHKLVRRQTIMPAKACGILRIVSYARKVPRVEDPDDWERYILAVLKALRSADKAGWHHRMVSRAAHIIYEENPDDTLAVQSLAAKHELSQQIFTKTMSLQVWKPDHEQPGRHFVYTGRYVVFFVHLLCKTNDKENLINLARRIRKKESEFYNHSTVWNKLALSYLGLIRNKIRVPQGLDNVVFSSITPEDFSVDATRLEAWILSPGTTCPLLEELRDVMDFKKVNNLPSKGTEGLKGTVISDMIAEIYASIYDSHVADLRARDTAEENRARMSVDNILRSEVPAADGQSADPQGSEQQSSNRPKKLSVTRVDIIKRAEALNIKAPTIATPKPIYRALAPASQSASVVAVVVPKTNTMAEQPISVPGSVHDSADDESELSDIDDVDAGSEAEPGFNRTQTMFPNLHRENTADDSGTAGSDNASLQDVGIDDGTGDAAEADQGADEAGDEVSGVNRPEDERQQEETEDEEDGEENEDDEQYPPLAGHVPAGGFMAPHQPSDEMAREEAEGEA